MKNRELQKFIIERDFSSLCKVPLEHLNTPTEIVAFALANFFLGNREILKKTLSMTSSTKQDKWLFDFINSYVAIDNDNDRYQSIAKLVEIKHHFSNSPFIMGELNFGLGFLFHQIENLELSFLFFKNAIPYYREAGCATHEWYANLNLLLSLRKQGKYQESFSYYQIIENGIQNLPQSAKSRAFWHFSSLLFVEGNINAAIEFLNSSISIAKATNNSIQEQECLMDLFYIRFKENLKLEKVSFIKKTDHRVTRTLIFLLNLIAAKNHAMNIDLLIQAKKLKLHPFFLHRIIDIFLQKLEKCKIPLVEKSDCISYIEQYLILRPMFIPFYDIEYYKVKIFGQSGDYERAILSLNKLEEKNFQFISPRFNKQYNELQNLFRYKRQRGSYGKMILNTENHLLKIDKTTINLAKFPILEKALAVLMDHHPQALSIGDFFQKVYHTEFNPMLHEARVNSLLIRLRSIQPLSRSIQRRNNVIKILGFNKLVLENRNEVYPSNKKEIILSFIREKRRGVTAKTIKDEINIPLRTIQLYLKELLHERKITKIRNGRMFLYIPNP